MSSKPRAATPCEPVAKPPCGLALDSSPVRIRCGAAFLVYPGAGTQVTDPVYPMHVVVEVSPPGTVTHWSPPLPASATSRPNGVSASWRGLLSPCTTTVGVGAPASAACAGLPTSSAAATATALRPARVTCVRRFMVPPQALVSLGSGACGPPARAPCARAAAGPANAVQSRERLSRQETPKRSVTQAKRALKP